MSDGVRVGVIGTGWGRMHIGAFRAAGAEVTALCGRDARRTEEIARTEGIGFPTTDVQALCDAVDVVVVASADRAHPAHVRAALAARRPVLCEKPLALTLDEARQMAALAAETDVPCAINFPYRMLPAVTSLHRWLRDRRSARVLEVVFRNHFLRSDAGASGDLGGLSHLLDATHHLLGSEPLSVEGLADPGAGRGSQLIVTFTGGATAVISHRPTVEPGSWGSWSIAGDDFEAGFSAGYRPEQSGWRVEPPRVWLDGRWTDLAVAPSPVGDPWALAHVEIARAFLAVVAGGDWPPDLATFEDGLRAQALISAGLTAAKRCARVTLVGDLPV